MVKNPIGYAQWPQVSDYVNALLTLRSWQRHLVANPNWRELLDDSEAQKELAWIRSMLRKCGVICPDSQDPHAWIFSDEGRDILAMRLGREWDRPSPLITTEQIRVETLRRMKISDPTATLAKSTVRGWTQRTDFPVALPGNANVRAKIYPRESVREWIRGQKGILID